MLHDLLLYHLAHLYVVFFVGGGFLCCAKSFTSNYIPFVFVFIFFILGDGSKKTLLQFTSKSLLPVFSSRTFIVSSLKFRSLIHFEFIFVYGVK